MPEAARKADPLKHTSALKGLLWGLAAGAVVGLAVGAIVLSGGLAAGPLIAAACSWGGLAAVATGASIGAGLGQLIGSCCDSIVGAIDSGDSTVEIGGRLAARAIVDHGECAKDSFQHIAQGSASVLISCRPAARKGDKGECSFEIAEGSATVLIGGETVTYLDVAREVPLWLEIGTIALGLFGPAGWMRLTTQMTWAGIGLRLGGGFLGGMGGGALGNWLGGRWFGEGSTLQKVTAFAFGWAGSSAGSGAAVASGRLSGVQIHSMPPRTPQSDAAVQVVTSAMNSAVGGRKNPAVGVTTHANGTVTYTVSGKPAQVEGVYKALQAVLPKNYIPGNSGVNHKGFFPALSKGRWHAKKQCAEPKLLQTPSKSPITGMSIMFRSKGTFMHACPACRGNAGVMQGHEVSDVPISPPGFYFGDEAGAAVPSCCGALEATHGGVAW